jgi:hypothetical protein
MSNPREVLDPLLEQYRTGKYGDPWIDVMIEYVDGNPEPIAAYLRTMHEKMPWLHELESIAGMLQFMHAKSQKRPRGRPPETWARWRSPKYIAAWFVEHRIANWRRDNNGQQIPDELRGSFITEMAARANTWPSASKDDPITEEQIRELLRLSQSRRLPF